MDANERANIEEAIAVRLVEYDEDESKTLSKWIYQHPMERTLWRIRDDHKDKLLSVTASKKYDDLLDQIKLPKVK